MAIGSNYNCHLVSKTIVFQSYRTVAVPSWIQRCMQSVQTWCSGQHFEYRFIDDHLFDYVPEWYRCIAGSNLPLNTNLARLLVARELLAAGYDRTIWVDADILVFDADHFHVEVTSDFAFCHEAWVFTKWGSMINQVGVNNAICVFVRGNAFLEFCVWAHEDLVRRRTRIQAHGTSTRLLTELYQAVPFPLLVDVGMLSPVVAHDIRIGSNRRAQEFAALHGAPMHAINLGGSICGQAYNGRTLGDHDYAAIVDIIEDRRGGIFKDAT